MGLNTGIGAKLRKIRHQWQLSLREVEERSLRLATEHGNPSYQVSASWLDRLEREEHELTVNKLLALAEIYNIPIEHLLGSIPPDDGQILFRNQLSSPNATMLLTEGPLENQARYLLPDAPVSQPSNETALFALVEGALPTPYRRGIIGKLDLTLAPMIPPGSTVHINVQKRAILSRRNWVNEFQRPIYCLMTREGFVCGWCELDKNSEWLTMIPHPMSPVPSSRWRYRTEIENLGTVVGVAIRLAE